MYAVVEIDGKEVIDPTLVGILPGRDLRVFGPFDSPEQASGFINEQEADKEKFVILALEWYRETI